MVQTSQIAHGSRFVLMRILTNLISNAIKNTDEDKILIRCRDQGSRLRIDVCDIGAGMTPGEAVLMQESYQRTGAMLASASDNRLSASFATTRRWHSVSAQNWIAVQLPAWNFLRHSRVRGRGRADGHFRGQAF